MTIAEAVTAIRRVGAVENDAGKLRLRFPETAAHELQPAVATLRAHKAEALALLSDPDPQELVSRATSLLNATGTRLWREGAVYIVGVWSDLDGPEVRAALRTLRMDRLPVRHLDGDGVPQRYKERRVPERPRGMPWSDWEAAAER